MNLAAVLAALALLAQPVAQSPFDQPIGELTDRAGEGPLDRLSINQMMRFSTLPDARMREFQCAGIVNWPGSQRWPAFALDAAKRSAFVDGVAGAIANDVQIDREIAAGLIAAFSAEPPHRDSKGELPAFRAEMEKACSELIAAVRSGRFRLAPLAEPTLVDPTLATCYARYMVAAEATEKPEEAASLRATAAKAEALALAGKQGEPLALARAGLAKELAGARGRSPGADEEDMMRLVICLPAMEAATRTQSK